jgi:hypothetical protein
MRVIVCGGRGFTDSKSLFARLDAIETIECVIEGGQRTRDPKTKEIIGGADYWANQWARSRRVQCITVNAEWKIDGLMAGPIRNSRMLRDYGKVDAVVSFPGGKGTADMKRQALLSGVKIIEAT